MKVYGFTGTQSLTVPELEYIERQLGMIAVPDFVFTGGCTGVDATVGRWYARELPEVAQRVILPYNLSKVDFWWRCYPWVTSIRLPAGSTYMDRNDELVRQVARYPRSNWAYAFPRETHEQRRSGTWATVRRFRAAKVPVTILPLTEA